MHLKGEKFELFAMTNDIEDTAAALDKYLIDVDVRQAAKEFVYEEEFKNWYWLHKGAELIRMDNGKFLYLNLK